MAALPLVEVRWPPTAISKMNFSGCCDCIAVVDFSVKFLVSGSISAVM
jgi:hypothetical protein